MTSVLDVKTVPEGKFVVTNGSRVNLNPMNGRHSYAHHMEYKDEGSRESVGSQWICGSTCMEHDRLFEVVDGPALYPGDKIIYERTGGYTICLTPLFIHYFPAVWVEKQDGSVSPRARRLCEKMLTGDPFDIDIRLDDESTNRNVEILNTYFKAKGIKLTFEKILKEYKSFIEWHKDKKLEPQSFIQWNDEKEDIKDEKDPNTFIIWDN